MTNTLRCMGMALLGWCIALPPAPVGAQEFPTRTVRVIVPSTAGQVLDVIARVMAQDMAKSLGQPVIVENRAGANQLIGYEHVAKQAPPDGHTLVMVNVPSLATLPVAVKDLRFDPVKDISPFLVVGESRSVWGSAAKLPWKTLPEQVAYAKANPGRLNYGTSSLNARLVTEAFVRDLGIEAAHIPYPAASPYVQALITGEVHMGMLSESTATMLGDRFRVLAVSGERRLAPYLDVPTFAELGYPQVRGLSFSMAVRSGTPKAAVEKLRAAGTRALQQPEVRATLAKLQLQSVDNSPETAAKRVAEEVEFFIAIAKKIGVEAQ